MDMNLYVAEWLIRERLAQARAAGARSALVEAAMAERRPVRVRLGTALVSLGRPGGSPVAQRRVKPFARSLARAAAARFAGGP